MVTAALRDPRSAPLPARLGAILLFVEKMTHDPRSLVASDVDDAKRAGVTEDELYDVILVASLFQFYNAWVDANGVEGLTPEGYAASGVRLAKNGYLVPPAKR